MANPIEKNCNAIQNALNSQKHDRLVYNTKTGNFSKVNRREAKRLEKDGKYETKLESLEGRISIFIRKNKIEDITGLKRAFEERANQLTGRISCFNFLKWELIRKSAKKLGEVGEALKVASKRKPKAKSEVKRSSLSREVGAKSVATHQDSEIDKKTSRVAGPILSQREKIRLAKHKQNRIDRPLPQLDFERNFVFADKLAVKSQNYSRDRDLSYFIIANRKPLQSEDYQDIANLYGLVSKKETFNFSGNNRKGVCHGAVISYLKTAIKKGSTELAAQKFNGGMPVEAFKYQSIYSHFDFPDATKKNRNAASMIITMIISGKEEEMKNKLIEEHGEEYLEILKYIKNGVEQNLLSDQEVLDEIQEFFIKGEDLKNTFSMVREYLMGSQSFNKIDLFAFELGGLKVVETIYANVDPMTILNKIPSLSPGYYHINIPAYTKDRKQVGAHAAGIIIDGEEAHFFDPNLGIGRSDKSNLYHIIFRDFAVYSGIDISTIKTSHQLKAAILGMESEFSLYRVEAK